MTLDVRDPGAAGSPEADLDEREALLSCGGALMLAQAWGRRRGVLDAEGRGPGAPSSAP
jgi:hypothetical protein